MAYSNKVILFVFLAVLTSVCHTYVERYKKNGPQIQLDHWNIYVPQGNAAEIKQNGLFLFSSDQSKSVNIQQDLPFFNKGIILKLSADMKCENVQSGEKPWNRARLLLVQNDGQKDRWDFPHGVAAINGTKGWESYQALFTVQPETKRTRVVAQLSNCSGTFQLKNIHLYPVIQTKGYTWVKKGVLFSWGVFGIFLLVSCFLNGSNVAVLRILLTVSFIVIVFGTVMPGEVKTQVSQEMSSQLQNSSNIFKHVLPEDLPKLGHFVFFAVFGLMLSLLLKQTPFFIVLLHILMAAGGTEMAQFFIDGRTALLTDFLIDTSGGLAGLGLVLFFSTFGPDKQDH